ncbi:MAG: DNA translocase FtsK, partial [Clostridiaceae bacterium]|nr:DNA translocase FtsK [Clostridiaceae bacterium]
MNHVKKKRARILHFPMNNSDAQQPGSTDSQVSLTDSTQEIYMGDEPISHYKQLNILDINDNGTGSVTGSKLDYNATQDKTADKTANSDLENAVVKKSPKTDKVGELNEPINEKVDNIDYSTGKNEDYIYPPIELLSKSKEGENNMKKIRTTSIDSAKKLESTLESFGIEAKIINVSVGPAFTRYELQPGPGVKVSRIVNLTDDIALNLAATGVRIEAPIPGKAAIGIEVPNKEVAPISLRSVLESAEFKKQRSHLSVALGKDISGENVVIDLAKMPHVLIAGATGSGKSVCINSIIISLLYKSTPEDVKILMIDPKVVELGVYNGIPHLLIPVVTDPNKAAGALRWAVSEMTTRYKLFADRGVRDLLGYNASIDETGEGLKLPQVVIIIDELADLMMVAPHDVEDSICRLAQMARAAGMHLVIATQRPSVNVITGVIKANIPSRVAFAVSSQVDSRTIIDMGGAEKLLGKGDMLYY